MPSPRPSLLLAGIVALLAVGTAADAQTCKRAAKLKALGKKEYRLLRCHSRVAATGDSSGLSACEAKASDKFVTAFSKTGLCGGVPTPCEDTTCCEGVADRCASEVAATFVDTFPSRCEAAKRKAAGQLASRELRCYARAAARLRAVDGGCIAKATARFTAAMTRAGTCPDGGSAQTFVEDSCVEPAVETDGGGMVTEACPSTTTTTTTATTTTTTPHQPCGTAPTCGGSCPAGQSCVNFAGNCLCFDDGGCAASAPACNGPCSNGGTCIDTGVVCLCINGTCPCGASCLNPEYECFANSGPPAGCFCGSAQ